MPFLGGASKGGALAVESNHIFANTVDRDTYFTVNPTDLVTDLYTSAAGALYKWDGAAWVEMSTVIKGADGAAGTNGVDGADGRDMVLEYSNDGANGWSTTQTTNSKYWRFSTDGGATFSIPSKFQIEDNGLPAPYYAESDARGNLAVRTVRNGITTNLATLGEFESEALRYNNPKGGVRFVHPDGFEYFAVRTSPNGNRKGMVFGNYNSETAPNYLATSDAGFMLSQLTNDPCVHPTSYNVTTNVLGGTRIEFTFTPPDDCLVKEFSVNVSTTRADVKFNTYVMDSLNSIFSTHQSAEQFNGGFGSSEFKRNLVAGLTTLPLSQPVPLLATNPIKVVFDFDSVIGINGTLNVLGSKLRIGRVQATKNMNQVARLSLAGDELWNGRIVVQTDGDAGLYVYVGGHGLLVVVVAAVHLTLLQKLHLVW